MKTINRIYFHKVRWDFGTAPCVDEGILSQGICKFAIRNHAARSDVIVGLSSNDDWMRGMGRLIYFAWVTDIVPALLYYTAAQYRQRLDSVYRPGIHGEALHKGADYANYADPADYPDDPDHYVKQDTGGSGLLRDSKILISQDYIYLGARGNDAYAKDPNLLWIKQYGLGQNKFDIHPETRVPFAIHLTRVYDAVKASRHPLQVHPTLYSGYQWYLKRRAQRLANGTW